MRFRKYMRPVVLAFVALISCQCTYVGYRGSLAPDAYTYAASGMPKLMTDPTDGRDGPHPEIIFFLGFLFSAPFALLSTLALIIWVFNIRVPTLQPIRPKPKK